MNWLWTTALKSSAKRAVQAAAAYLAQESTRQYLSSVGVNVEVVDPVLATAATYGTFEFLRSWLKVKVGFKFL